MAETLAVAYQKQSNVSVRIARIFNTYGPRMHNNDGRVVSNFILQALQNKTLTVSDGEREGEGWGTEGPGGGRTGASFFFYFALMKSRS